MRTMPDNIEAICWTGKVSFPHELSKIIKAFFPTSQNLSLKTSVYLVLLGF